MRNLVLILLLANLLFAAWQRWVVPPPAADPYALAGSRDPELVLLQPAAGAGPAADRPASVARRCMRLGPFADPRAAATVSRSLTSRGMRVATSSQSGEVWIGRWVQVVGLADRASAEAALQRLNRAGLRDAYIVRGDQAYLISLGVFRGEERADRLAAQARAAGLETAVTDRFRSGTEYWLTIEHPADQPPRLQEFAEASSQILRAEPVDCAAPADGQSGDQALQ